MTQHFKNSRGQNLAYSYVAGRGPTVVFLGGFKSDMAGSKATHFEAWAQARGQAYLRFDYSGHGVSEGVFEKGSITQWAQDARELIAAVTSGAVVLVGSSMGGWISLILARDMGARVVGLIGIAAAPDFTEDSMWASFDDAQRAALARDGVVYLPSEYGDPYPITQVLIEESRGSLVLRDPLVFECPVRLYQGTEDTAVTRETALRLFDHIDAGDLRIQFVKGADHSFSSPNCLDILTDCLDRMTHSSI